ncbi:MAG: (2Fe-2S) ferredoxin domain-containing protein [Oscillochloris sp.]|nr:(2Fe-2S) ferredoxin domain-containing protein [Oscillochloris sp.]
MGKHDGQDAPKVEHLIQRNEACLAICTGKHCSKAGAAFVIGAAQAALEEAGHTETHAIVQTRCQDYCDDGPVMTVVPGGYPYLRMDARTTRQVILSHIRDGNPMPDLMPKRFRRRLERRKSEDTSL